MKTGSEVNILNGKVILITGAGKGRGRAAVLLFARQDALLALNDISPVNLDETAALILKKGGQVKAYVEDIAKKMPVQALLNQVLDDFGRIDILLNCAEVEPVSALLQMDEWDWQRTLDVNLTGAFLLTQSVGRIMKENKGGTIIHMSAQNKKMELHAAYHAAKSGLAAVVKAASAELAPFGIRVWLVKDAAEALEVCCQ
jgi:NAD(P)-dependent dehydrogenase (short-subunit alcohol dehydrogenase family)